jgi:hypothetical protein
MQFSAVLLNERYIFEKKMQERVEEWQNEMCQEG